MEFLIRRGRGIHFGPLVQEAIVIAVNGIDPVQCLSEKLFLRPFTLGFLANARLNSRPVFHSHRQAHIFNELSCGIVGGQAKQLRSKSNHITFFLTSKADEILINLHARTFITMERTAHHAVAVDLMTIIDSNVTGTDLFFDLGVDSQKHHLLSCQGKKKASAFIGKTE